MLKDIFKKIFVYTTIAALPFLYGCKSEVTQIVDVNGIQYSLQNNTITQLTEDKDGIIKYGVISDLHGETRKVEFFSKLFLKNNVDGIIVLGDLPENENLRYGKKDTNDKKEIEEILYVLGKTGLPILVIPGNHETKKDYETAMKKVRKIYPNIFDMTQYRIFDGKGVDFVSLPGYQIKTIPGRKLIPDNGYYISPEEIMRTGEIIEGLDDVVVLLTHGPPYTNTSNKLGPGVIYNGRDVGDETTTKMMEKYGIKFAFSGHIHEAGGNASTLEGKLLPEGKYLSEGVINFGTLEKWRYLNGETYNGMAGIVEVNREKIKYTMYTIK